MGYNTQFFGELKFKEEPTRAQIAALSKILGEDCRDHPEWGEWAASGLDYIVLEFTDDFSGVRWAGWEKTYGMVGCVNLVIRLMQRNWPEFGFTGSLQAQGERVDDRWILIIGEDGWAAEKKIALEGTVIECPHCGESFVLEELEEEGEEEAENEPDESLGD